MKINTNDPIILGRIIPDSGKIHQNQEVLSIYGGGMTLKNSHYKDPPKVLVEETKNEIEVLTELSGGAIPLNAYLDGTCRTIKAQYAQTSIANFLRTGTWGATGVIETVKKEDSNE